MILSLLPQTISEWTTLIIFLAIFFGIIFYATANYRSSYKFRKWRFKRKTKSQMKCIISDKRVDKMAYHSRRSYTMYKDVHIIIVKTEDDHIFEFEVSQLEYSELDIRQKGILLHYKDVFYHFEEPIEVDEYDLYDRDPFSI